VKNFVIVLLLFAGILCMSIYDMTGYRLRFNVSKLQDDTVSVDSGYTIGNGAGYIELVWNTGDTGSTIIIDTPGVYIISAKDVWAIKKANANGSIIYDTIYKKAIFLKGYPDYVKIDTIVMNEVLPYPNYRILNTHTLIDQGRVYQQTYRDTGWTDGVKTYYTESHPGWSGFWSGKLDSIIVMPNSGKFPITIGTSVMVDNRSMLGKMVKVGNFNKWRASY